MSGSESVNEIPGRGSRDLGKWVSTENERTCLARVEAGESAVDSLTLELLESPLTDPAGEPSKTRPVSKKIVIGEAIWLALLCATWAAAPVFAPADRNSAIAGGVALAVSGVLLCGWLWRAQASRSGVVGTWAIV